MARRPLVALGLVALLVAAGCQAPASPQSAPEPSTASPATDAPSTGATATDTATQGDGFVTTDADLGFDPERVYHRVGRLLDVPRDRRPRVQIRVEEPPEGGGPIESEPASFTRILGITPEPSSGDGDDGGVQTGAIARGTVVTLYNHEEMNESGRERILAHEFVHVYQTLSDLQTPLLELGANRNTVLLYGVVVEGAAEYVQEEYSIRYQGVRANQTAFTPAWKNASAYVRWTLAPYQYGSRYYELRIDDPANVSAVYDDPPRTTEQVIHGLAPDEEPVADLRVAANASGWFSLTDAATKGELFARVALSTELDWDRAADAAEGWDADRLLTLSASDRRGYAWALRWDSAAEAREFRTAFEDYAADRSRPFDSERVGDDTVVVFAGAEPFVEAASATGTNGNVTVHV